MANNPTLLTRVLAEDGEKNTIPATTGSTTGVFSEQYGFQSINSLPLQAGGKAVQREDFNGVMNLLGGIAFYAQKGFTFNWANTQAYYKGCVVIDTTDGLRYECIADVAAGGSAPSADATHWQIFKAGTDIDYWFRQKSTKYEAGNLRCNESLPFGYYLECTTGGTTSSSDLTISTPTVGNTVSDGTVVWTIRKISSADGVPLGIILPLAHNSTIPAGYLLCDGSAVSRTMYPDLFNAIGTTYGAGDGSTTFNVPDYNAAQRFAQGSTVAGTVKSAGLPNIEGTMSGSVLGILTATGAFVQSDSSAVATNGTNYAAHRDYFDASRSNPIYGNSTTVQPPALTARYIIKAFDGQTASSALIDITQYAADLANKADRDLSNLTSTGLTKVLSTVSKAQNGYQIMGNGLIIQWGLTTAITYDQRLNVTFPIEFPNACLTAVANFVADATMTDHAESYGVANITKTSFDIENQYLVSGIPAKIFPATWIAIGY